MKIIINTLSNKEICQQLKMRLEQNQIADVELISISNHLLFDELKKKKPDLFIGFNLAQFEVSTLTDSLSFNLLPVKQLHILTKKNLPNEKYLERPLSIAMFFLCTTREDYEYYHKNYPMLPYLELMEGWQDDRCAALYEAVIKLLPFIV